MATPTLVTASRLESRLHLASGSADAADALQRATARFIAELGFNPLTTTADVATLDGNSTNVLLLPGAPVTAVQSVVVTTPGAVPVVQTLVAGVDYQLSTRIGGLYRLGGYGWPFGFGNIVVTYTHGWDITVLPDDIADAILEQAEGIYRARAGISLASMGPQQVRFDDPGKSQRWVDAINRLKRGRVSPA